MRFDYILGNPPYLSGIHTIIFNRCISKLENNGVIDFIHPISGVIPKLTKQNNETKLFQESLKIYDTQIKVIENVFLVRMTTRLVRTKLTKKLSSDIKWEINGVEYSTPLEGINLLGIPPDRYFPILKKYRKFVQAKGSISSLICDDRDVTETKTPRRIPGVHISYIIGELDLYGNPDKHFYKFRSTPKRNMKSIERGYKLKGSSLNNLGMIDRYLDTRFAWLGLLFEKTNQSILSALNGVPCLPDVEMSDEELLKIVFAPDEIEEIHHWWNWYNQHNDLTYSNYYGIIGKQKGTR